MEKIVSLLPEMIHCMPPLNLANKELISSFCYSSPFKPVNHIIPKDRRIINTTIYQNHPPNSAAKTTVEEKMLHGLDMSMTEKTYRRPSMAPTNSSYIW
jgi:hypothetical protein